MKLLLLCIPFASLVMADTNGTSTVTSTLNTIQNTNAPNFIAPLTMGGGDVNPFYNTVAEKFATCAGNQLIFEGVNTDSGLRGSGAPKIGNYGMGFSAKVIIPFGDGGKCERRMELINKSAKLEYYRSNHNLCMGELASFKAADPDVYLNDNFFVDNEEYKGCRGIFVQFKIAHKQQ